MRIFSMKYLAPALSFCALFWTGCQAPLSSPSSTPSVSLQAELETVQVSLRHYQQPLTAVGNLTTDPGRESRVGSPLAGRVVEVYAEVGDHVRSGQSLACISSPEILRLQSEGRQAELRLNQLRSSYSQKVQAIRLSDENRRPLEDARSEFVSSRSELKVRQAELRLNEKNLKRAEGLFKLGVISARELEVARAEVTQSLTRQAQAKALYELAQEHRQREQMVSTQGALTGPKLTQTRTDLELAEQEVANFRATARSLGLDGERGLVLRAPRSGVLVEKKASLGQAVTAQEELFQVVDSSQLWLWVHLPEGDLQSVPLGSQAQLSLGEGKALQFKGKVSYISPLLETQSRTAKARIVVPNGEGKLKAGMFVTARFDKSQSRQILTLPPEAVVTEGIQNLVFCPDKGGYRKVPVEIGLRQSDWVEISKGLQSGQVVVRRGQSLLEGLRK